MSEHFTIHAPALPRAAIQVPHQAAPIDRALSSAALQADRGVDADLLGMPIGTWLEEPGKYLWENYGKPWLNQ
jgi:hypothetical protein